jgi:hypothetical protein
VADAEEDDIVVTVEGRGSTCSLTGYARRTKLFSEKVTGWTPAGARYPTAF